MLQKKAVMALATGSLALGSLIFGSVLSLQAQGPGGPVGPGGPGGPGFGRRPGMGFRPGPGPMGFGGPVVKNQPYSATESSTDTMKRKDGKTATHTVQEQKWRDATGRTRTEVSLPAEGKRPAIHHAEIFDPVAHTITSLDFSKKVAVVRHLPEPREGRRQPPPDGAERKRPTPPGVTVTETNLPGKQIAGVYAIGKTVTRTVAPGTHGNTEAIVETSQVYTSPDLKIVLSAEETGPRGSMVHQVTALNRADPDSGLFLVPGDFTVKNAPEHGFRGPRGPRGPGGPGGSGGPAE